MKISHFRSSEIIWSFCPKMTSKRLDLILLHRFFLRLMRYINKLLLSQKVTEKIKGKHKVLRCGTRSWRRSCNQVIRRNPLSKISLTLLATSTKSERESTRKSTASWCTNIWWTPGQTRKLNNTVKWEGMLCRTYRFFTSHARTPKSCTLGSRNLPINPASHYHCRFTTILTVRSN